MREVPATDAKARLAQLLSDVERGETVAITRHGKPIAHLVPATTQQRDARLAAIQRFVERRSRLPKVKASLHEILQWRHEGHRF